MNKKAIELLERVLRVFNGVPDDLFSTRQLINQTIAELQKQPPAGGFTKSLREFIKESFDNEAVYGELSSASKCFLKRVLEACGHLDQKEAELQEHSQEIMHQEQEIAQQAAEIERLLTYLKNAHNCTLCKHYHVEGEEFTKYCEGCFGSEPNNWEISDKALKGKTNGR